MKKTTLFFVIIFIGQLCFAQKGEVDNSIVKKKVDSLVGAFTLLLHKDLEAAVTMAKYTLHYSKKHNYLRGIGQSYNSLAGVYNYQGKTEKSITYLIKSAQIYESINDQKAVAILNINISYSLYEQSQYNEAKQYALKAHSYALKANETNSLLLTYTLFGIIGVKTKNSYDYVIKNLNEAKEFSLIKKDSIRLAGILNLQGETYIEYDKSYADAIILLSKAVQIIIKKQPTNNFNLGYSYLFLGKAHWKMKQYKKALQYNDTSLIYYNTLNYTKGLRLTYENRKDILASLGKYKESYEAFELFNQYKDSVFKKDQAFQLNRIRTEYETEQITIQKETAEAKLKLTEAVSKQNKNYFISAVIIGFLILMTSVFYFKRLKAKKKAELVTIELKEMQKRLVIEKQSRFSELKALKAQMNPHFIFNALNSIQDLILKEDTDASYDYIVLFAELIRSTLSYSNQDFISIEKELNFLEVYLKLEKLRFGKAFNYTINYEGKENLEVPSLMVQPFVENALIHGLFHKEGEKQLNIVFSFINNTLQCIITDNGIGRKRAKEISIRLGRHHKSFALSAIEKRLEIFKKQYKHNTGFVIEDLYEKETAQGTKVILTMPFKKGL